MWRLHGPTPITRVWPVALQIGARGAISLSGHGGAGATRPIYGAEHAESNAAPSPGVDHVTCQGLFFVCVCVSVALFVLLVALGMVLLAIAQRSLLGNPGLVRLASGNLTCGRRQWPSVVDTEWAQIVALYLVDRRPPSGSHS